jgi:hypothetical protein
MKIIPNQDVKQYEKITQAVKDNDGYCPCLVERSPATKCVCEEFKEQETEGACHCGRFIKIKGD